MGLIHSYALWNNKGRVGKSTITFHLAMRYAELHPERIKECRDGIDETIANL